MSEIVEGPLLEILLDHGPVQSRGSTEHGHRVVLQAVQHGRPREPRHPVDEDGAALGPRTEDCGPGALWKG